MNMENYKELFFKRRKSPRLPNYDYENHNYYFVTICTHEKRCLFGNAADLNRYGKVAEEAIENIRKQNILVEQYVIMPNHIHMIIVIGCGISEKKRLDTVIGLYKSGVSREIHKFDPNITVWQRSFHDHVIRNRKSYEKIWEYVTYNPQKWKEDCFYCDVQ